MPLAYAICSAIIGTQSVIQAKCLSELVTMTLRGENQMVGRRGLIWFVLCCVVLCSVLFCWVYIYTPSIYIYIYIVLICCSLFCTVQRTSSRMHISGRCARTYLCFAIKVCEWWALPHSNLMWIFVRFLFKCCVVFAPFHHLIIPTLSSFTSKFAIDFAPIVFYLKYLVIFHHVICPESVTVRVATAEKIAQASPFTYLVTVVWLGTTVFWLVRMNRALAMFHGLFIIPALQV